MQRRNGHMGICSHLYAKSLTYLTVNGLDHGKGMLEAGISLSLGSDRLYSWYFEA